MKSFSILFAVLLGVTAALAFRLDPIIKSRHVADLSDNSRVIGGQNAESGFAPYQVALFLDDVYVCGGAIVGADWVVTAAHCINPTWEVLPNVYTGMNKLSEKSTYYVPAYIYIHCDYEVVDKTPHNDIALIQMRSPIIMDLTTQPVQVSYSLPLVNGDPMVLTGWGATATSYPDNLQKIVLDYMDNTSCQTAYTGVFTLTPGTICTLTQAGEGTCYGDSGGPLVNNNILYGVVSWGVPCAMGVPDAYTSVPYYLSWISDITYGTSTCHTVLTNTAPA